ncbi:hypothetical protein TrVFT333_002159 [Trichoderma virens FT-333]|nr:hypothetical protein TrVFT333_002159 [Trichoderma virens FT-333]
MANKTRSLSCNPTANNTSIICQDAIGRGIGSPIRPRATEGQQPTEPIRRWLRTLGAEPQVGSPLRNVVGTQHQQVHQLSLQGQSQQPTTHMAPVTPYAPDQNPYQLHHGYPGNMYQPQVGSPQGIMQRAITLLEENTPGGATFLKPFSSPNELMLA